jgi:hypothetical protein
VLAAVKLGLQGRVRGWLTAAALRQDWLVMEEPRGLRPSWLGRALAVAPG